MAMLNTLKELVSQKREFAEQANILLDSDDNFDKLILMESEDGEPELPEGTKDPLQNDNSQVQPEGEEPMPINLEKEPETDSSDGDILNAELDMGTDTVKNVLPSPPSNAGDQIDTADSPNGGDIMDEEIDDEPTSDESSGSDESKPEEGSDLMNEEIPLDDDESSDSGENNESEPTGDVMDEEIEDEDSSEPENEDARLEAAGINIIPTVDIFNEDISLEGDGSSDADSLEPAGGSTSDAGTAPDADLTPAGDNSVTAAVKEKVGESNDSTSVEPSEPSPADDSSMGEINPPKNNAEIVKKTASLSKAAIDLLADIQSNS